MDRPPSAEYSSVGWDGQRGTPPSLSNTSSRGTAGRWDGFARVNPEKTWATLNLGVVHASRRVDTPPAIPPGCKNPAGG